ncbi:MAG TPA: cytochrome-c oxidase, cbb3-type subunit III [Rhizobiales bacterium]|nr:cytochrome-c oxidase, cbb3-type subunit III [Hyphomicrobiales bacterium]
MSKIEIDEVSGTETTGHEWDGIKELNTPLPKWWLYTFYACIIWAIGYMIAYPSIPLLKASTPGLLGVTNRGKLAVAIADAKKAQSKYLTQIASKSLAEIRKDPALFEFATAGGKAAFAVNCIQCHGSGAQGGPGFPNLNDDDWLWGGTLEDIHTTITHGIRFESDDDTRTSQMPSFGADEILDKDQIIQVANYVLKLSGQENDEAAAEKGAEVFAENCASCHGEKGTGGQEFGAPDLADAIWLYGNTKDDIIRQVTKPRHGIMPAWAGRLDATTIKELALYVHALGGGK